MAGKPVNITIGATIASSLGAAVRDAKNQLGTLGAKVSSLNDKKVKVDQLVAMKAQTNDLGRAYGQTRKRADELSAAYAAMGPPTAAQTREMRAAEQAAEKAGAALTKQREALRELRASLHSAGVDTRNLGTESVRLGSQLDTLKRRTEALSRARQADKDNRDKRGQHLGNVMSTAAVGMTLAAPLKTAMDFEAQMSRVGAVSNSTKEQQVQLTAKAREMGRDTKFSALEAGQGMEYLAMAGFNANQQMAAIGGVLDVAAAAGTELGRTSDIVSNALTGFGLQADQAGRVGDVLTKTFTGSNTTLESLGETLKYVAPVASSAGASIELVAAMTGVLGDAGIQGSMAGTTLRNTFLRLIAPAKDAQKHMKQLGISAEQMREIMADPEGQQAHAGHSQIGIHADVRKMRLELAEYAGGAEQGHAEDGSHDPQARSPEKFAHADAGLRSGIGNGGGISVGSKSLFGGPIPYYGVAEGNENEEAAAQHGRGGSQSEGVDEEQSDKRDHGTGQRCPHVDDPEGAALILVEPSADQKIGDHAAAQLPAAPEQCQQDGEQPEFGDMSEPDEGKAARKRSGGHYTTDTEAHGERNRQRHAQNFTDGRDAHAEAHGRTAPAIRRRHGFHKGVHYVKNAALQH